MLRVRWCIAALLFVTVELAPSHATALPAYGITTGDQLIVFDVDTPQTVQVIDILGLQPGESIHAIDIRPINGRLYALTNQARLYTISPVSGNARPVGAGIGLALQGTSFGLDFSPVAGYLRVVSNTGQNFRIDPETGAAIDGDPAPGIQPDTPLGPGVPEAVGAAYSNNFHGAGTTTLFVIDAATDELKSTDSPNGGLLSVNGPLDVDAGAAVGFDIVEDFGYVTLPKLGGSELHKVMLGGGSLLMGTIGDGTVQVKALAVHTPAETLRGVTADNLLISFSSNRPDVILTTDPITGLRPNETIRGIDYRPATQELYALGSTSRLYTIDTNNGAATPVGLTPFEVPLAGSLFGFDFDPVADRIRIVSNIGLSMRVHPETGAVVDGNPDTAIVEPDTLLNPGDQRVVSIGYTNSVAGATESTLLGMDIDEQLVRIGGVNGTPSPDEGVVTVISNPGSIAVIDAFDLSSIGNVAYAAGESEFGSQLVRLTPSAFVSNLIIGGAHHVVALAVQPPGTMEFTQTHLFVKEGNLGHPAIRRSSGAERAYVEYQVIDGTADNLDYVLQAGTVEFGVSETVQAFPIEILQDPTDEPGETIILKLQYPSLGATIGPRDTLTITIEDDDGPANAAPSVTILSPDAMVNRAIELITNVSGTASDDNDIVAVTWINFGTGGAGLATGTTTWTAEGIPLVPGPQAIEITAVDTHGAIGKAVIEIHGPSTTYHVAEGATGTFFDFDLLLANPNGADAPVTIEFLRSDAVTIQHDIVLPAASRSTIAVDEIPGLEHAEVSATVTSTTNLPIVVERTMRWDETGYGAHTEKAVQANLVKTWYFAEGNQGFFHTYFLLMNPLDGPTEALVEMFTEQGDAAFSQMYPMAGHSRLTIYAGDIPALADKSFWTRVTFPVSGIAERAMYFGTTPLFDSGHASAAVNAPSTTWLHSEGATGTFFTTFLLFANPNDAPAHVTTTYFPAGGVPVTVERTVAPHARVTMNVAEEDASLAGTAVAAHVKSDLPIVSERSMYWPGLPPSWNEAHNSFGVIAPGLRWGLAEGRVGGPEIYQTYILLANPGDTAADVTISYLRTNGTIVMKNYSVPGMSRYTVHVNGMVPELADESFGARIDSTAPIVVERAMYMDLNGVFWASGTNATATRLP